MEVEWYCCNYCYTKMVTSAKPFSLTQCGHIFCSKCISIAQKSCPQCKATNLAVKTINIPLEPCLQTYFQSHETLLNNLTKAIQFQNMQAKVVTERGNKCAEKYSAIKKEYWLGIQKLEHLKKKIKVVEQEKKHLEKALAQLSQESPAKDRHSVVSPLLRNSGSSGYHSSRSSVHSSSSSSNIRSRMSQVHFLPSTPSSSDGVFRVPLLVNVPRSARRSPGSRNESLQKSVFSAYSPNNSR